MIYITNALPGALLLNAQEQGLLSIQELSAEQAADILKHYESHSAVGHADTSALFSSLLGRDVPENRVSLAADLLHSGEHLLLAGLYSGPRLPEGSTTLPEGACIKWALVGRPAIEQTYGGGLHIDPRLVRGRINSCPNRSGPVQVVKA